MSAVPCSVADEFDTGNDLDTSAHRVLNQYCLICNEHRILLIFIIIAILK